MSQEQQKYTIKLTAEQLEALPKELLVQLLTGEQKAKRPITRQHIKLRNSNRAWEAKDKAILWSMWRQGKPTDEIAELLGRSKKAIDLQISRMRDKGSA